MKKKTCDFLSCKTKISQLNMLTNKCKCNLIFCTIHRLPESHNCSYNFKNDKNNEKFINDNKCLASKINKI